MRRVSGCIWTTPNHFVRLWMSHLFMVCLSIWRFGTLLKGASAVHCVLAPLLLPRHLASLGRKTQTSKMRQNIALVWDLIRIPVLGVDCLEDIWMDFSMCFMQTFYVLQQQQGNSMCFPENIKDKTRGIFQLQTERKTKTAQYNREELNWK